MKKTFLFTVIVAGLTFVAVRADEPKKDEPKDRGVRVAFVPDSKPMQGESAFEGAAVTRLKKGGLGGADGYWMQARSGVGDKFPVREEGGPLLFEVLVAKGDDDHLELETHCKEVTAKLELKRDKTVEVKVGGDRYSFLFPNIYVAGKEGDKPTTPKAMIIIKRLK